MYHTFYNTYIPLSKYGIYTCSFGGQTLRYGSCVIASLCRRLCPPGRDTSPWWRDSSGPHRPAGPERGVREASRRSWTGSGCVPEARRHRRCHAAPGATARSWASAAGRTRSCAAVPEAGWAASRCGPASAAWGWPGSRHRWCCWLAPSGGAFWKENHSAGRWRESLLDAGRISPCTTSSSKVLVLLRLY